VREEGEEPLGERISRALDVVFRLEGIERKAQTGCPSKLSALNPCSAPSSRALLHLQHSTLNPQPLLGAPVTCLAAPWTLNPEPLLGALVTCLAAPSTLNPDHCSAPSSRALLKACAPGLSERPSRKLQKGQCQGRGVVDALRSTCVATCCYALLDVIDTP